MKVIAVPETLKNVLNVLLLFSLAHSWINFSPLLSSVCCGICWESLMKKGKRDVKKYCQPGMHIYCNWCYDLIFKLLNMPKMGWLLSEIFPFKPCVPEIILFGIVRFDHKLSSTLILFFLSLIHTVWRTSKNLQMRLMQLRIRGLWLQWHLQTMLTLHKRSAVTSFKLRRPFKASHKNIYEGRHFLHYFLLR